MGDRKEKVGNSREKIRKRKQEGKIESIKSRRYRYEANRQIRERRIRNEIDC